MSKILTGTVVSNKTPNTIIVDVHKRYQHPRFKKIVNVHKKFKVHVESGTADVGAVVKIQETRPISKDKHFILIKGGSPVNAEVKETAQANTAKKANSSEAKTEVQAKVVVAKTKKIKSDTTKKAKVTKKKAIKKKEVTN